MKKRLSVNEKSEYRRRVKIILESAAWLTIVTLGCLGVALGFLSIRGASLLCVFLMLGLMASAWLNFEGGRHPCFLFLGMLFIFQCGRLLGYMTGFPEDPFAISVQTAFPFSVSRLSEEITLLLIAISGICVYIPCRISYQRISFSEGPEQKWLSSLYMLLAATLPFAAYKNYIYLSYIRNHGGYMSVYTDSAAILQSAGFIVRAVGLIGTSALLLLYLFERRRGYMAVLLSLFFAVSSMDLLIGFRGKFFVQILVFWYIRNLKTGKNFNLIPLFSAAAMISLLAVSIAGFREERTVNLLGPIGFVSAQGVSMNVTELAVEMQHVFGRSAPRYFFVGMTAGFKPGAAVSPGDSFATDLSLYLNPEAYSEGFGTGSTYLAEAYLLGGIFGVVVASLLLGATLSWIHNNSGTWMGALLMMASLGSLIYMPRTGLIDPLPMAFKSLIAMGAGGALIAFIKTVFGVFQRKISHRHSNLQTRISAEKLLEG